MSNNFQLAKSYAKFLDEVFVGASVTGDLTSPPNLIRQGANGNEIVYPQLSVSGLGDYDRNSGYTDGAATLVWETAKFNYDRGTRLMVDEMDNQESFDIAFGALGGELMRTKVAVEADAFCFAQLAGADGVSTKEETLTGGEAFLEAVLAADTEMDELEVPTGGRILYVTPTLLKAVRGLDTTKSREALDSFAKVVSVPQSRFYTAIDLQDGKSGGEELGHFKKASVGGKDINFMIVEPSCLIKWDKHIAEDVIPPNLNAIANAYMLKYRKYGIVDVYKNKAAGIYVHHKA